MKLSSKIASAMGVLFICVTLVSGYVLERLQAINQSYSEVDKLAFPLTVTAQKLVVLLSEFRCNEIRHTYVGGAADRRRIENHLRELQGSIEETMAAYSKLVMGSVRAAQTRQIERLWREYIQTSNLLQHLAVVPDSKDATQLLSGRSTDQFDTLMGMLRKVTEANAQFNEQALHDGAALYEQASYQLMVFFVLVLLLLLATSFVLRRLMLRSLGADPSVLSELIGKVNQSDPVSGIDTSTNIFHPRKNATGLYAELLDMMHNLRHHGTMLHTLTANVPGAVLSSNNDDFVTITYCSDGLSTLTGYTRDELTVMFDNHFIAMITPEDRNACLQARMQQTRHGDTYEVEYRITHKQGGDVWVLDRGRVAEGPNGQATIFCVLIDISELKQAQMRLHVQEERLRTVLAVSNDMVWESDMEHMFRFIKGADLWLQDYGVYPKNYTNAVELVIEHSHPDDADMFSESCSHEKLREHLQRGVSSVRLEHRIGNCRSGIYTWYQSIIVPFTGLNGSIERVVVCVTNINARKNREHRILHSSQRDPLTNLYNKRFTEEEIARILQETGDGNRHGLFIIDVDNFKAANDSLGHLFGDAVLTDIAVMLSRQFRVMDVVGRVGGDEFMVLMRDVASKEQLENKGAELCRLLARTFQGEKRTYSVSGSIGVALYPQDGTSYRELYKHADAALYMAKKLGKGRCCFYNPSMDSVFEEQGSEGHVGFTDIMSRQATTSFKDNVMAYIFELLYEARDIDTVVNIALGMIGGHFNVSRAYVLINSPDDLKFSTLYEWCNTEIAPQKDILQDIPYTKCGNYMDGYSHDGVFYCEEISKLDPQLSGFLESQGIKSMLHLAIYDSGRYRGCVGFDDCVGSRRWTQEEVATLSMLAKILGLFLLQDIMGKQLEEAYNNIANILDGLDVYAYVCDEETYELLYINAKTRALDSDVKLGTPCYSAFFGGRDKPCDLCPFSTLSDDQTPESCLLKPFVKSLVIYNANLNIWTKASASRIPWSDGRRGVLLSCVDITEYKNKPQEALPFGSQ